MDPLCLDLHENVLLPWPMSQTNGQERKYNLLGGGCIQKSITNADGDQLDFFFKFLNEIFLKELYREE